MNNSLKNNLLKSSFRHFPGIGIHRERIFWEKGIQSWEDLQKSSIHQLNFFNTKDSVFQRAISASILNLKRKNSDFFARRLPKSEYYRISLTFPNDTLFLDIETTGLSRYYDNITLIGWSINNDYSVHFSNSESDKFLEAIATARAIVTFNGSIFDLPFIQQEFPNISLPLCHIDLRFLSKRIGISGGQKLVEEKLGFNRPNEIGDLRGDKAPLLWFQYQHGNDEALEKLVLYNYYDIEGMKYIFDDLIRVLLSNNPIPNVIENIHKFYSKDSRSTLPASEIRKYFGIDLPQQISQIGPTILLKDLNTSISTRDIQVVGIDLSGSEKRPTGWCVLTGAIATTKRLRTTQEIVLETLKANPDIVSIDSPLSLPRGRKTVYDDDPGRNEFGIMRECERMLKKRGVNVYPSLIQSMQALTKRGIDLANHFRSLGIPVVESYPGAAQDILKIPRKGSSIEYLAKGLKQFGIKGDFLTNNISHDELDAITSAMVALFFWDGRFEGLGNSDEDYLIIPKIKGGSSIPWNRWVVGISGPIATGKTTAGRYLEGLGFSYGRYSQVIENLARERNIKSERKILQQLGDEVHEKYGQRWLATKLIASLPQEKDYVIDGLRFPEDTAFLFERYGPGFLHVFIDSPAKARLERYLSGGYSRDDYKKAVSHNVEKSVEDLEQLAHVVISNGSDLQTLYQTLDDVISTHN